MLQIAIILFREMLEISLIIGIVMAATRGLARRNYLVLLGIIIGLICSLMLAYFTQKISELAHGAGQDLLNALILSLAVLMIGWTVIWMKKHASNLSQEFKQLSEAVKQGEQPCYALTLIIAATIIREGAEIILFYHGLSASHQHQGSNIVLGAFLGSLTGISVGCLLYFGLVNFFKKSIFKVTNCLLIFLAASMAAQIPNFLASAGYFSEFSYALWDSSKVLSEQSTIGNILHILIGYNEKPTPMQVIFYLGTLSTMGGLFLSKRN